MSRLENVSSLYGQKNLVSTRSIRERRLPATYNPGNAESAFSPLSNLQSFLYDPRFRRNNARQLKHLPPILRTRSLSHAHAPYLTHTPAISSTRPLSHAHASYLTQTPAISSTRPLSHAHGRKTLHVNKYKATRTQNCTCLHFASGFREGCNVFIF